MTARLIYANSEKSADLFFATRFFAPDPFLFVQEHGGRRHLVTSALEIDRARRTARVDQIHDWNEIKDRCKTSYPDHDETGTTLVAFFLKELNIHEVDVPDDFPVGLADGLRKENIQIFPVTEVFWPQRAIKTTDEITAIEAALVITGDAVNTGIEIIRGAEIGNDGLLYRHGHPLTSEWVRGEIDSYLVRQGAMPSHTIVAGGSQGADPHEGGTGHLPAHQPIILDVFPRVEKSGYWGDMTRTVCRGQPSARMRQAWEAVREAQEVAFTCIKNAVSGQTVHQAVTDHLTQAGFATKPLEDGRQSGFFHGTGHGLGLEIHEPPRIGKIDQILKTGHVITVEPGLYYPDMGGIRIEDVVVVEENGCRNLTKFPKFFEI